MKTTDYQVNFIDGKSVEITEVRDVIQKFGFLEFRGATNNQFERGSDLPLIVAYRAELIHSYEPSENAQSTILPQVRSINKRKNSRAR